MGVEMPGTDDPVEIDPYDRSLLEKIGRLRVTAWATFLPDLAPRVGCWLDDFELAARHWVIFRDGEPIAAARLSVHERIEDVPDAEVYEGIFPEPLRAPIAAFSRLVVHPSHRGRGLSDKLDAVRMAAVHSGSIVASVVAKTPSGPRRQAQFSALGFRPVGEPRPEPRNHPLEGLVTQPFLYEIGPGASIHPTSNRMGWSGEQLNEVSQEFVRYAAGCTNSVLDIGAAFGVATIPALAAGATVYANDISPEHLAELRRRTAPELLDRLHTVLGRFPDALRFSEDSLDAVHASQVFHYLTPSEVEAGLRVAFRWLRPGGRLFILAATPYQGTHAGFGAVFAERKARGEPWPGTIEDVREYNRHWSVHLVPPRLHVFDDELLSAAARQAGFVVEWARMFSRTGLPEFCRLDGRENVGLIAGKPPNAQWQGA